MTSWLSRLWKLNVLDLVNWLGMAVMWWVIAGLIDLLWIIRDGGTLGVSQVQFILIAGAITGLTYLSKRLLSGADWQILSDN